MRFPEWSIACSDPAEGVNCFWTMNGAMVIGSVDGPQDDERQEQRANLISAAPDMYNVLKEMVEACDAMNWHGSLITQAREALKKARGETA